MLEPNKVTSIIIDDLGVSITKSFDGDMVFRDRFIPGIKLKSLIGAISGGSLVFDPALIVLVESSDYTYITSEDLYAVDIIHNFNFSGSQKSGIIVETYDDSYNKIGVDTILSSETSVYIKIASPENILVVMKRVI
jgi:hypothetical protein